VKKPPTDAPGVIVFPPLLFGGALILGLVLHGLWPIQPASPIFARPLGALLLVLSAALGISGERTMRRAGTNVRPDQPTLALVIQGPFRFTRNPLYIAATGMYLGVALLVDALWPLLLLIPLLVVLRWGIVAREERYLEAKFGDPYRAYKARVRRWL
jgi:protein-S-isoprenylcysteine O-methyltransferase Ste14